MRPTKSLLQLALCLTTTAPLVSAWPGWLPAVNSPIVHADSKEASATSTSATTSAPTETASSKGGENTKSVNLNTAKPHTGTHTGSATGSRVTHTEFPAEAPAGAVVMQTPAVTAAGTPLYKIGDFVTWGWNYTNLLGTPTAIDVLVSCSTASETWTLTSNMTFKTKGTFVWDTKVQETSFDSPLLTAKYSLIIKDSEASISDMPDPGYLGTFTGFTFGLYAGQPYTPLPNWSCTACNAAMAKFDRHVLGFAVTMCLVTIISFTWFVSGLDLN